MLHEVGVEFYIPLDFQKPEDLLEPGFWGKTPRHTSPFQMAELHGWAKGGALPSEAHFFWTLQVASAND